MQPYDSGQLDDLLLDVKRLLGEDDAPAPKKPAADRQPPKQTPRVSDETRMYQPVTPPPQTDPIYDGNGRYEWNDPSYTGTYYGGEKPDRPVVRSHAVHAASPSAYDAPAEPVRRRQEPARPQPARQERPAQAAQSRAQAQKQAQKQEQSRRRHRPAYDEPADEREDAPVKRKKKKRWLVLLLLLVVVAFGTYKLVAKQPVSKEAGLGERKPGVSTILLAGTDKDGTRTDTMMLMHLDSKRRTASLVSVPRDTLVNGSYSLPKINSCYGWVGGGKDGMEELMERVAESIGFRPDGYVLVDLDSFVELVNIMGGVKFNVPVDMHYDDPSQDLHIDLTAGEQKLDGVQSMGVVRFRTSYAMADLQRVGVQRDFVAAAADQWMKPTVVLKAPRLLSWYGKNVTTDLSVGNLTWIAMALIRADASAIEMQTLPGTAGPTFYVLSPGDVVQTVNQFCNPYQTDITVDNLSIRS